MSDKVKITAVPDPVKRNSSFSMTVTFSSKSAGDLLFSVDEGRIITPAKIPVGKVSNQKLVSSFVISGAGSDSVNITCELRAADDSRLVKLT